MFCYHPQFCKKSTLTDLKFTKGLCYFLGGSSTNQNEIISFINKQDVKILDISTEDGDLEDVFIRLTKN